MPAALLPRRTITPPSSTPLERAVDAAFPRWDELAKAVEPESTRQNPALLPWRAAHWQIGQFDRYFADPRDLLANGLPWLRERGSAAAVRRAMGWLGYRGVKIEEDGALLHIDPGREITAADLRRLAHVVKASLPLHVHFYRVFHGLDRRVLRLNCNPGLNHGLLQADSGTPMDAGDGTTIWVSQGKVSGGGVGPVTGEFAVGGSTGRHTGCVRRPDSKLLNYYRLNGEVQLPTAGGGRSRHGTVVTGYVLQQAYGGNVQGPPMHSGLPPLMGKPVGGTISRAGRNMPRTEPDRTWETGYWDDDTWQHSDVVGGNIVIENSGE